MCARGYFGGGEGGECVACASQESPTAAILLRLGVFFAVIVVAALVVLKFGRKALESAAITLKERAMEGKDGFEEKMVERMKTRTRERPTKKGRCKQFMVKAAVLMASFGVKLKILISLYQVLNGLGIIFNIPYPATYSEMLSSISSIELNLPAMLPIDCLLAEFGGINFMHVLIIQVRPTSEQRDPSSCAVTPRPELKLPRVRCFDPVFTIHTSHDRTHSVPDRRPTHPHLAPRDCGKDPAAESPQDPAGSCRRAQGPAPIEPFVGRPLF